jgi:O-antigen/teichoic acid export membrane protein
MRAAARLTKNFTVLVAGHAAGMVEQFVLAIFLARYLGATDYGAYTTIFSFIFFGGLLANFGLGPVIVRAVSRAKEDVDYIYSNALIMMTVFSVVAWGVAIGATMMVHYERRIVVLIAVACSTILLQGMRHSSASIVRAFERMEITTGLDLLFSTLRAAVGIGLLVAGFGLEAQVILTVASSMTWTVTLFIIVRRQFASLRPRVNLRFCLELFTAGVPIALIRAAGMITQRIDIVMLSLMTGITSVGLYGVAFRFLSVANIFPTALSGALLPNMAARFVTSVDSTRRVYEAAVRVSTLLAFPTAVLVGASSDVIVGRVFGQEYLDGGSAVALRILVWALCLNFMSGPVGTFMIAGDVNILQFVPYAVGVALLNVVLNLYLIPRFSFYGASASTVMCAAVNLVIKLYWVNRLLSDWKVVVRIFARPAGAAGLMAVAMYTFRGVGLHVTVPAGLLIYLAVLIWWRELTRQDLNRIATVGSELGNRARELMGVRWTGSGR